MSRKRLLLWSALILLAVFAAGCGGGARSPRPTQAPPPAPEITVAPVRPPATMPAPTPNHAFSPVPAPGLSPLAVPTLGEAVVQLDTATLSAIGDLAARLGIARDEVLVTSIETTEMPVGTLGCTEEGGAAPQGQIFGREITLLAREKRYVYRTDGSKLMPCSPVDIPGGRQPIFLSGGGGGATARPDALAVAELSGRLGIDPGSIKVASVQAVEWPDASLGCAKPGQSYAQVITPGYRIILEAGGITYVYHGTASRVLLCSGG